MGCFRDEGQDRDSNHKTHIREIPEPVAQLGYTIFRLSHNQQLAIQFHSVQDNRFPFVYGLGEILRQSDDPFPSVPQRDTALVPQSFPDCKDHSQHTMHPRIPSTSFR